MRKAVVCDFAEYWCC